LNILTVTDCLGCQDFVAPDSMHRFGGCKGGGNDRTFCFMPFTEKGPERCPKSPFGTAVQILTAPPLTPAEQRVIEAIRAIRYGSVTVEVANGVLTLLRKGETEKL
jgi:hypothetical protein